MLFRRIVFTAVFVGMVTGLLLSVVQIATVNPIIFAAEAFEIIEESVPHGAVSTMVKPTKIEEDHHDDRNHVQSHSHEHSHDGWAPEDGAERTAYTVFANLVVGIGFAAVLLSLMTQAQGQGFTRLSLVKGLLWGLGGFLTFFVAPGVSMPPEIPGVIAAPIEHRQLWWLLIVIGVGFGLLLLAFAPIRWKGLGVGVGVVAIVLPYLAGVPHLHSVVFGHPDPLVVQELMALQQDFILYSGVSNLLLWLTLGALCGWLLNRCVFSADKTD